jgi:hypothetical protein
LQVLSTHPVLEHRARALVALLALAIAAFALAACGGSGGGGSGGGGGAGDAQTLLTQTFTGSHKIDSGKANLQVTVDAQGDPTLHGPIKLAVSGPFQTVGKGQLPKFDLALDVNAQGQGIKAGLTSTSDQLFVNFGGSSYVAPASLVARLKQSYQQSQQKSSSTQTLSGLGIHPLDWLKDPTVAGTETVGGVTTEHITAHVDVAKLLDDLDTLLGKVKGQIPSAAAGSQVPSHLSASTRTQIEQAVKQADVDVWTGKDDHTVRKVSLALSVQPKSSGSGPKSATVSLSFEIDDLNQPQTIAAPTATKPLSDLLGQVQGLLGGALGGGALGGSLGSGAAPSAGTSKKVDQYAKCLQQANGDATKMQACQSLLTK